MREAGITVILGAVLRDVQLDGRRVKELELATRYGDMRLSATGFVDATGDAALTWQAGFACRESATGRSTAPKWWCWRISTRRAIRPARNWPRA